MNNKKQHRNDKLQKSSLLFLQLGLVLALFLTYTALEFESIKTEFAFTAENPIDPPFEFVPDKPFTIQRQVKNPVEIKQRSKSIETIILKPDRELVIEDILPPVDPEEPSITDLIDDLPGDETQPKEPVLNDIIFEKIEDAPIFPGCEGLEKEASKVCFTKEISKFVNKKFNTGIADGLSGKQRIWVEFKVDKTGAVKDIRARSPYKQLEKEAIRVIEKLPQMTPGKQRKRPVNVKYTLPIIFQTY